jgi:hypothetical protein
MANTRNENEVLDDGKHEEGMITQAEFRIFQPETQQALQAIPTTLARLTTGNNLQQGEAGRENYRERTCERHPIPRRQLAYEDELSDDEEYVEHMFRHNQRGLRNMGEREAQTFQNGFAQF